MVRMIRLSHPASVSRSPDITNLADLDTIVPQPLMARVYLVDRLAFVLNGLRLLWSAIHDYHDVPLIFFSSCIDVTRVRPSVVRSWLCLYIRTV